MNSLRRHTHRTTGFAGGPDLIRLLLFGRLQGYPAQLPASEFVQYDPAAPWEIRFSPFGFISSGFAYPFQYLMVPVGLPEVYSVSHLEDFPLHGPDASYEFRGKLRRVQYIVVYCSRKGKMKPRLGVLELGPEYPRSVQKLEVLFHPYPLLASRDPRPVPCFGKGLPPRICL